MARPKAGRKRRIEEVLKTLELTEEQKHQLEEIKKGNEGGDWRPIPAGTFHKFPEFKNRRFEELFYKNKKTYWIRCAENTCYDDNRDLWFSSYNGCNYSKLEFRQHLALRHNFSAVSIRDTLLGQVQFKKAHIEQIQAALSRYIARSRCPLKLFESTAFVDAMEIILKLWQINRLTIRTFLPSRHQVVKSLTNQANDIKMLIWEKASKLADSGACILIDHHTSKGYQESRKKLGVGLSFFDGSKRHCVLLAYREVANSTVAYNKEILDEILQEYDLALPVSEGRLSIVSDCASDAVGLARRCSPLTFECQTHTWANLCSRTLSMSLSTSAILKSEWQLLERFIKCTREIIPARDIPRNGFNCLNTFLQSQKVNNEDIPRYARLEIESQPTSLDLSLEQLTAEIERKTEKVREECSTPEGKLCGSFVSLCNTRFRKYCINIIVAVSNLSRLRELEDDEHPNHYLMQGNRLPSDDFLFPLAKIVCRIMALIGVYDSQTMVTSRSTVNDYCELMVVLVQGLNSCSVVENHLRKHFIKCSLEQMFQKFLLVSGEIVTKSGSGVPTRITDASLSVEYLFYPNSPLDLWKLQEVIKKEPVTEYTAALLELVQVETRDWKSRAVSFIKSLFEFQNQDEEEALPEPPMKRVEDLSLHPALQKRTNQVLDRVAKISPFAQLEKDLACYDEMSPSAWLESYDESKSNAENVRMFWQSPNSSRLFPALSAFSVKLLLLCCASSSGLERLFSELAGNKRQDRKRLRASTQEKIGISSTSDDAIDYLKKF